MDNRTRFMLSLETRTIQVEGVVMVDISEKRDAAAWETLVEKLGLLGIRVRHIPTEDVGLLNVELDALRGEQPPVRGVEAPLERDC